MKGHSVRITKVVSLGVLIGALCWQAKSASEPVSQDREGVAIDYPQELRFRTFTCLDTGGFGFEVFSCLAPVGWRCEGGIRWQLANASLPAVYDFSATGPDGVLQFRIWPQVLFFWTSDPGFLQIFPIGSIYAGKEVHPPLGVVDFLSEWFVPRALSHARDIRISGRAPMPAMATAADLRARSQLEGATPGSLHAVEAGRIRTRYQVIGTDFEEEFCSVVILFRQVVGVAVGPVENVVWGAESLFSFRTPLGRFDENVSIFQTIAASFRLSPRWLRAQAQLLRLMANRPIESFEQLGEEGLQIIESSREVGESDLNTFALNQRVYEGLAHDLRTAYGDIEEYVVPGDSSVVMLPAGYSSAWGDREGGFIVARDPDYPSPGPFWDRLTKKK